MTRIRRSSAATLGVQRSRTILLLLLLNSAAVVWGEYTRDLKITEGAPIGTQIGFIEDGTSGEGGPPYLILSVPGVSTDTVPVDTVLDIDQKTGEIKTKVALDREKISMYYFVAISQSGPQIRVNVHVIDENDNAPIFPTPVMNIEFPENTPRDVKRNLNPAKDLDIGNYNTQKYNIVSGNVNNAFRLSYHREKDGVLYLDLQINGPLDCETIPSYSLVIEALDGGVPPLKGNMTVNIVIQDVNDNQPVFNQTRYFGVVPENAAVGTSILQVHATDADSGDNGAVEYAINRRQSDKDAFFNIDPITGLISVNKPLDFETKEVHELVVVAKDRGLQPLETTAFISIKVTDVNDNQPSINLIFLSDDATPKISEGAEPGEFVARISVNDPDSKNEYSNVNVTLNGGDGRFGLTKQDSIIYLVIVSMPIDREIQSNYTLSVVATDQGSPPLHAFTTFNLQVTDVNDNAPEFAQSQFYANVVEIAEPGTSVFQLQAIDRDEGVNSEIKYSLIENTFNRPSWFEIDSKSGLITTKTHVDCDTEAMPKLIVVAADKGNPSLSSSATVLVTIHDVNDNEPIFTQTFYNVTIPEDKPKGSCVLKVSASDSDCGVNAMVNYTLLDGPSKSTPFYVKSISGDICIASDLDYETKSVYEFLVIATDRGGLSATSAVKITITDVNDNEPVFSPREYRVNFRDDVSSNTPIALIKASDADSGHFGAVSYRFASGNDENLFRIDRNTGELFVVRTKSLSHGRQYALNISATDGAGSKCAQDAQALISVANAVQFERARYEFNVAEDVAMNTVLGSVKINAFLNGENQLVKYFVHSGDPAAWFSLDPFSGQIKVASFLDYEKFNSVLLNVQAIYGNTASTTFTQVLVKLEDKNDNAPEFDSNPIRLSVPENAVVGVPLFAAYARDRDSGPRGSVRYFLSSGGGSTTSAAESGLFAVDPVAGLLSLSSPLDYETSQRHTLVITASDEGEPQLQTNLTVFLEVQDVNDNYPVFEQTEYSIVVSESLPSHSQILQVIAVDLDTGNNAKISYRLADAKAENGQQDGESFGVCLNSGWIYLKKQLDRETTNAYTLKITASDNGTPRNTATAMVQITISDYNDNDPQFTRDAYEFAVEENRPRGTVFGMVKATDKDAENNAAVKYSLIPSNSSFQINPFTGELSTREPLDREMKSVYELVAEAKDQGVPSRSSRVAVRIRVTDVNDNAPVLDDPQEDVISVREEQPPGTEVVRVRAVDPDDGYNATLSYSILKGRDTDGYGVFTIDPITGIMKTRLALDHAERSVYRIAVAATDNGIPPKQTVRVLRVEVLDVNDNRPTFSSSSLLFKIREDVPVGHVIGSVIVAENSAQANRGHIMYTLNFVSPSDIEKPFDIDRRSGSLVVIKELDREICPEYRLEVRILDTSSNPQSSAVIVKVELIDVNDNAPSWSNDPLRITLPEDSTVGATVWNFTATDADTGPNKEIRYGLVSQWPALEQSVFSVDSLTGNLILNAALDYEKIKEFTLIVKATDQAVDMADRKNTALTVQITIEDVNDNAPVIVSPISRNLFIGNGLPKGAFIERLITADADTGDNGRVTYVITSGNDAGYFALNYESGDLTMARSINTMENFLVNVTVSDHGTPPMHAHLSLNISTRAKEENQLKFTKNLFQANISEDLAPGSVVFAISNNIIKYTGFASYLRYEIPQGSADNTFVLHDKENAVILKKPLDRETKDQYVIPIYVKDTQTGKFDSAVVIVNVIDVNDNVPYFHAGSCYPLNVPENMDSSVIHTVVALDRDLGNNAKIVYSIVDGNIGNKFHVDSISGELTAQPLDRETQSHYQLTIAAQDLGSSVSLTGYCNVTVYVEDENDNDPQFEKPMYLANIAENTPIGSTVLTVKAIDLDLDLNAQVIYSLRNESDWTFRINNQTGAITTNRMLDREEQNVYAFQVVAIDMGRYKSQYQTVNVKITVEDVNDNKPVFGKYLYSTQISPNNVIGSEVLKVSANDRDKGANGEVVYKFSEDYHTTKFRINANTGAISSTASLANDAGRVYHIEVMASDRGTPSLSANCLVEIKVIDGYDGSALALKFQNTSYTAHIAENAAVGETVIQVFALKSDGRRRIVYSFAHGNENEPFEINSSSGLIRVRNSSVLDYETNPQFCLTIVAQENSTGTSLFAFAELTVYLSDQNDNTPVFTQDQYFTSVLEGISKGTYVIQLLAVDGDSGPDSRVSYHIVDGNHDNAFIIEPPTSNVIKTNIVLDAEIRNTYKLTVIATDDGIPQLTGTATIRVNVIDVNDNQPSFPPHNSIAVSESEDIGSVITSVVANDVDSFPWLVYSIDSTEDEDALATFAMDRHSGKLILKKALDYEKKNEYKLRVVASDRKHSARTMLTVNVADENDNAPVFDQPYYQFTLSSENTPSYSGPVTKVHARDADTGDNSVISYSLRTSSPGFSIDPVSGMITVNQSLLGKESLQKGFFDIVVIATDNGDPQLFSEVSVKFDTRFGIHSSSPTTLQSEYRISVRENVPKGKAILRLNPGGSFDTYLQYKIIEGNEKRHFDIIGPYGDIIISQMLDRETTDVYSLKIAIGHNTSIARVHIVVQDASDDAPLFTHFESKLVISENTPVGTSLMQFHATDNDLPPNSDIRFEIVSGNDRNLFAIDSISGLLTLKEALDYDYGSIQHNVVIKASDVAKPPQDLPLSSLAVVKISVTDENDNEPKFPISEYLEFVAENEPIGVTVFIAKATDQDKGIYGKLNYSIISAAASGFSDVDDSWKLFRVNPITGLVTTNAIFDYETRSRYAFTLLSCDTGGKCTKVKVRVEIESKDEFYPQFTERTFRFTISGEVPVGFIVGHVTATDRDKGPDGRIVYQLTTQHPYFKINRTNGAVMVKKKLDTLTSDQDISLVVSASSGRQGSFTNNSIVEIVFDQLAAPGINLASSGDMASSSSSVTDWLIVFFVLFILVAAGVGGFVVFLHFRNRRQNNVNKSNLGGAGQRVETYVDPGAFDTMPIRGTVTHGVTQFGPPKYDEIPTYGATNSGSNSAAATTSELSGSEQSGSSGRGSAEDGEDVDEEIRMINEGQSRTRRNPDDDNLSDVSVHNTQEYLARLGIIDSHGNSNSSVQNDNCNDLLNHRQPPSVNQMNMFDDDGANEADITNIIYAKLNDVASERGGSTQEEVDRNSSTGRATSVDRAMVLDGYQVPTAGTQLSMSGSLSSIVHSEEELTGSYNWDYLLDWGPQYQPLAHVFSEIARLKDDAASVKSATSGTSSNKSKTHQSVMKTVPPPLITNVAPRSITAPVINTRPTMQHSTPHQNQMLLLPRSPISHDTSTGFSTSAAMSPSFSPSLSPLATRSPSVSPLHLHTMGSHHHMKQNRHHVNETDIRI